MELNKKIAIEFHEVIDPFSVNTSNFVLYENGQAVNDYSVTNLGNIVRIQKNSLFLPSTKYLLTIKSTIQDSAGNAMGVDYNLSFVTTTNIDTTRPVVESHFPEGAPVSSSLLPRFLERAVINAKEEISPTQFLAVSFSKLIDNECDRRHSRSL